jgi:hypothetical protein
VPKTMTARLKPDPAPADGATEVEVLIDLKDEAGQPLDGASLTLTADQGTVGPASEEGNGRYRATFVPSAESNGKATIHVRDTTGAFESPIDVSLRERPSVELGVTVGLAHSLGDQLGPRAAISLWRSFLVGRATFGGGLSVGYGSANQSVTSGTQTSLSEAHFVPVCLRLGYEAVWTPRFSLVLGVEGTVTFARLSTGLTKTTSNAWGAGGGGFIAAGVRLGPGRLMLEVGYDYVPVKTSLFNLQAGGLAVGIGYRFLL